MTDPAPPRASRFLARYLEDHENAHVRASLLGSLAEGLMTKSQVAGTFISCADCGTSTNTLGAAVHCAHCGAVYELKPDATYRGEGARLTSRTLTRRRSSPTNWFLADEDWSVADLFSHLLRLPADRLLPDLCARLGRPLEAGVTLEHVLFWPRLRFGRKTIQPDVVAVFDQHLVLFEFKRPAGARLPGWEVAGQVAFAHDAARALGHDWTLFVVPGPRRGLQRTAADYAREAAAAQPEALAKYSYDEAVARAVHGEPLDAIAARIRVHAWEAFLEHADAAAAALARAPGLAWQAGGVRHAVREFHRARAGGAGFGDLAGPRRGALGAA